MLKSSAASPWSSASTTDGVSPSSTASMIDDGSTTASMIRATGTDSMNHAADHYSSTGKYRRPWPVLLLLQFIYKAFFIEETVAKKVPLLRGKIHLLLMYLSPLWITSLVSCCSSRLSLVSVILSSFSSLFNFTASALLHNISWSDMMFRVMTKADYIGIFLMISGSCSPLPLLVLDSYSRLLVLITQWASGFLGVAVTVFGTFTDDKHSARAAVYLVVGLSNCLFIKIFLEYLTFFEFFCLLAMAGFYVVGAVFYGRKSPDLWPGIFGYHELFHLCCFAAGVCTFLLNRSILLRYHL